MTRWSTSLAPLLALALLLCGSGGPAPAAGSPEATPNACRAFPETGKSACGRFLEYWQANGGLARQGLPLTGEFTEISPVDGKAYTVQYFERVRLELHPGQAATDEVQLGLLGLEQFAPLHPGILPPVEGDPFAGDLGGRACARFHFTGETVCGPFLTYWREHGGLAQYGYPISPVFLETSPSNGRQYPTQYFERARFEYHTGFANTPDAVQLGLLGNEQLRAKYPNGLPDGSSAPSPVPMPRPNPLAPASAGR